MYTDGQTVELRITQSVDANTVSKAFRLLAEATELRDELFKRIVSWVSPEVREMIYLNNGLRLLCISLSDMLKPGSNQLLVGLETQLESLEGDITKASIMLTAFKTFEKSGNRVGPGRAGHSSVHVQSRKGTERKGRGLAKRKRDAEGG